MTAMLGYLRHEVPRVKIQHSTRSTSQIAPRRIGHHENSTAAADNRGTATARLRLLFPDLFSQRAQSITLGAVHDRHLVSEHV